MDVKEGRVLVIEDEGGVVMEEVVGVLRDEGVTVGVEVGLVVVVVGEVVGVEEVVGDLGVEVEVEVEVVEVEVEEVVSSKLERVGETVWVVSVEFEPSSTAYLTSLNF